MKTKTLPFLLITLEQYEEKIMQLWLNWCTTKVRDPKNLQKMLVCQALFNWWKREILKLEAEFIEDMQVLNHPCQITCMKAYDFTIQKIYKRFSKPLIKYAHDNHSITNQN